MAPETKERHKEVTREEKKFPGKLTASPPSPGGRGEAGQGAAGETLRQWNESLAVGEPLVLGPTLV